MVEQGPLTPEEENTLAELQEKEKQLAEKNNQITIDDCNNMSWKDFEVHVGKLYEKMGYEVEKTSGGGDHGCDLVLSKNGRKTVVDAKHWKSDMHSKVVGQVLRAISYYDANDGMIIGISHFTKWAIEEAEKTQIELVDRDRLEKLLEDYPTSLQKSKSISDITVDDIYNKYPNCEGIIQKMVQLVLKDRERVHFSQMGGDEMIELIEKKLKSELLSPEDRTNMLKKILELLKSDDYDIDLIGEKQASIATSATSKNWAQNFTRNMTDPMKITVFMDTIRSLQRETNEDGKQTGMRHNIPEEEIIHELLYESRKFASVDEIKRVIRKLINEAAIYESIPGHYDTV